MNIRWIQKTNQATCTLAALLLTGCTSIVYKDSATTYVAAGRAATNSISDSAASLSNARDKLKGSLATSDATCPIAEPRIYLRSHNVSDQVNAALRLIPSLMTWGDCRAFIECTKTPEPATCSSTCYSAKEANCIATVEEKLAIQLKGLKDEDADRFSKTIQPFADAIAQAEYGRPRPVAAILVKENISALTEYLDMLGKLATKRESDVGKDAQKLATRLTNTTNDITEITSKKLSTEGKATQALVTGAITTMGKFVSDLQNIAEGARDGQKIRKLVVNSSKDIQELVANIKAVAGSDAMLGAVFNNLGQIQARQDLQARYSKSDAYTRSLLLAERNKYSFSDGKQAQKMVDDLFDAMNNSHEALIQLVMNPSDEDKQDIANARFQEFKIIAEDVSTLVQLFY